MIQLCWKTQSMETSSLCLWIHSCSGYLSDNCLPISMATRLIHYTVSTLVFELCECDDHVVWSQINNNTGDFIEVNEEYKTFFNSTISRNGVDQITVTSLTLQWPTDVCVSVSVVCWRVSDSHGDCLHPIEHPAAVSWSQHPLLVGWSCDQSSHLGYRCVGVRNPGMYTSHR